MNRFTLALLSVIFSCCVAIAVAPSATAGEYNTVLNIGDAAPAWSKLPGADGKEHSLADLADKKAVVLVFTCLSCPTAVDYEQRIDKLRKKYGPKGVEVVAVCVNKVKADNLEAITARVKEKQLGFPYLYDESQKIAKDYGAIFTPEFYVLDGDRKIAYMGALDDKTEADAVEKRYVQDALDAVLAGKPAPQGEVIARGCRIRYVRERGGTN